MTAMARGTHFGDLIQQYLRMMASASPELSTQEILNTALLDWSYYESVQMMTFCEVLEQGVADKEGESRPRSGDGQNIRETICAWSQMRICGVLGEIQG
jgi:hypothetical protein